MKQKASAGNTGRDLAVTALTRILVRSKSLDQVLLQANIPASERPLVQELVSGCVRHYYSLNELIQSYLKKPLRQKDQDITSVLLLGAYQLLYTRIPPYAAVSETVSCASRLGKPWAKNFVNAVLRALQRDITDSVLSKPQSEEATYEHPQWYIDRVRAHYGIAGDALLKADNTRAPMCLRVNPKHFTRNAYMDILARMGVISRPGIADHCLVLENPMPQSELPGLAEGAVSIQDQGAQLASSVLNAEAGDRVLDACAAPGGKAFDLLERFPGLDLTVLESDETRLQRVRQESERLGLFPTQFIQGDATNLNWWDHRYYDKVLLDAPCSGSGTLRRHPDIKLLKTPEDLDNYHELQLLLLNSVWQTVKPGGTLVYCTCSIFPVENGEVIQDFFRGASGQQAHLDKIDTSWGLAEESGRQLLPKAGGADGFYFARLIKTG